jgi:hypothetical protein
VVKSVPILECPEKPIDNDYVFKYNADGYKKAEIQIGYDSDFNKKTYNKLKVGNPISEVMKKLLKDIGIMKHEKLFARVYAKGKKVKDYSNVCEFELNSIEILNEDDWIRDGYYISSEEGYKSEKALKIPYAYMGKDYHHEIIGPYSFGSVLSEPSFDIGGAKISMDVYPPKGCDGYSRGHKNFVEIQYRGTKLFRKNKWYPVKTELSNPTHSLVLKIGTFGKCKGDFFIDNIKIEKDGKIAIWNFE